MLTQSQVNEIKRQAKLKGYSDQQIVSTLAGMTQTNDQNQADPSAPISSNQAPSTNVASVTSGPTSSPIKQQTQPEGNIVSSFFKSLYDTGANYVKFVGEAAAQGARAVSDPSIMNVDNINKQVETLQQQSQGFIQQAKLATDPNEKLRLLDESRKIDLQIDSLGTQAGKVGDMKQSFLVDPSKIKDQGTILQTGAKATAGAMSLAMPGGEGAGAMIASGAAAGGLSAFSNEDASAQDIVKGLVTGAVIGGATAGILKTFKSNLASTVGEKLDAAGNKIQEQTYVKAMGVKPLAKEGGAPLLGKMKEIGIVPGDADAIIAQTDAIFQEDAGKVYQATQDLAGKGIQLKVNDLKQILTDKLSTLKSSLSKKPIEDVLKVIDEDLAGKTTISPDELYLLKSEYGGLGKWNSLSSNIEKQQAKAWRDVYMKANNMLDSSLKDNGFSEFAQINDRLHIANQASDWATRVSKVAPNKYNIGLYDWLSGLAGTGVAGVPGGLAVMAGKKVAESPQASSLLGKITQRAGQTLEKIKPVNLSVDQSLMNMGVVGATKSSMSGPVPNNLPNTEENTTQQKKTDQLDNQITPPNKTNLPQAVKPFGGRSKNELMQLALAQGATYKDLQEISNIYDTITPDPKNIDNLMTQRKSLADAGFDTSSVDKQLADMGYSKTGDAATKAKSAAALQVEGKANAGLKAIDSMETLISSDKGLILSTNIPMVEALKGQNRKQYEADIASLTDAIGGLRTGASVSKEQQIFYNKMLPKIGDSPETISLKLAAIRRELNGYINQNVVDTPVQP